MVLGVNFVHRALINTKGRLVEKRKGTNLTHNENYPKDLTKRKLIQDLYHTFLELHWWKVLAIFFTTYLFSWVVGALIWYESASTFAALPISNIANRE